MKTDKRAQTKGFRGTWLRLVTLELVALAGLVDLATYFANAPAVRAAAEANPVAQTLGPDMAVAKVLAIALIGGVVLVEGHLSQRLGRVATGGALSVALLWTVGAASNVAFGLL